MRRTEYKLTYRVQLTVETDEPMTDAEFFECMKGCVGATTFATTLPDGIRSRATDISVEPMVVVEDLERRLYINTRPMENHP